jgi:hypothetical protein
MVRMEAPAPHEHQVDEAVDFDIGPWDWILGFLTMPLLFWVLMYAVTGGEWIFATRGARYRLYAILLAIEVAIVAALLWWLL